MEMGFLLILDGYEVFARQEIVGARLCQRRQSQSRTGAMDMCRADDENEQSGYRKQRRAGVVDRRQILEQRWAANQPLRQRISQRQVGMGQLPPGPARRAVRRFSMAKRRKAEFELPLDALVYHGRPAGTCQQGLVR